MRNTIFLRAIFAMSLAVLFAASPACAQAAPSKAPDTKIFGDWGVRCYPSASQQSCEMQETLTQKKTGTRIMSMSVAFVPQKSRYVFQLAVPLGVSLAKGAKIVAKGFDGPAMVFRRCDRGGCYVEGFIDDKMIDALAASTGDAKVVIVSFDGRTVNLPFSLRGFGDARKAMLDLVHAKAPAPPASATP
jgi:invasion protein IalB